MAILDKSYIQLTFHRVVLVTLLFSIYYDFKYTVPPTGSRDEIARNTMGGRFKFLTFISAVFFQVGYYTVSLLNDYFGTDTTRPLQKSTLQKFRDWFFTTITIPLGFFGSFWFWGIYTYDREIIHPPIQDTWMPKWLNHIYHTLPLVAVLLEMILINATFQRGLKKYVPIFLVYASYSSWVFYVAHKIGFWIYPFFEVINLPSRLLFIAFLGLSFIFFTYIGEKIHRLIKSQFKGAKGKASDKKSDLSNKKSVGDAQPTKSKGKSKKNKESKPEKSLNKNQQKVNAKPVQQSKNKNEKNQKEKLKKANNRAVESKQAPNTNRKQEKSQNKKKGDKKKNS